MNRPDSESPYLEPYRAAVDAGGPAFEALLWRSREFQRIRFETIAQMADPTGRVVADLGCGRADFLAWMHEQGVAYGAYVGVEGIPELVRFCEARALDEKLPEATFVEADFAADADIFSKLVAERKIDTLVFSGSLNTFDEADALRVLGRAWDALERGGVLIFNFLSTRHPPDASPHPDPARRFDPVRMLDWALSKSRLTRLRHDYLAGHDATVAMRI